MAHVAKLFEDVKFLYEEITGQEWERESIPAYAFPDGVDKGLYVTRELECLDQILRAQGSPPAQLLQPRFSPRMEITETQNALDIAIELPGVRKVDISLTLHHDILHLRAEKQFDETRKKRFFRAAERQYGIFERHVSLPTSSDEEGVRAQFDEGVLQITVRKTEPQLPRGLDIPIS